MSNRIRLIGALICLLIIFQWGDSYAYQASEPDASSDSLVYLPLVQTQSKPVLRVNAPYFEDSIPFSETAIFWFGRVSPTSNYADVRVAYSQEEFFIHIAAFDRRLWYDQSPANADLETWDAVSLFLHADSDTGDRPNEKSYHFIGQLNWSQERTDWQTAYQGSGNKWIKTDVPFSTNSGWRGNALNDDSNDRGWTMTFRIPFSSLGVSNPPPKGTRWGLALVLHDRDSLNGNPISDQTWPEMFMANNPKTWGQLVFGLPTYKPPTSQVEGNVILRQGLNGINVVDAHVGGHTICGQPYWPDYFNGWGEANYAGYDQINIQNQSDVADWPCFSKYYVTFPLESIPPGKIVVSANLKMFLFGNAGQGLEPNPQPSLIQALTVGDNWQESTLTWNNAPLALENVSRTWVDPVGNFPGWPGIPYEWDVSRAVAQAHQAGDPLRLVLYSSDGAYNSGKYFVSSDTADWNAEGRPQLQVLWGNP